MAEYLTTGEVARRLGVGLNTVKRWIANGLLRGVQTPGGHWRIPEDSLEAFLRDRGMLDIGRPMRVLVVDDEPPVCLLLSDMLQQCWPEIEVKSVQDGYTGLVEIGRWRPDILLLDIFMPGIDGLEVLRRLRADEALRGDMDIIVITAGYDRPEIRRQLSGQADAVLSKPVELNAFRAAIESCRAFRRHMASAA